MRRFISIIGLCGHALLGACHGAGAAEAVKPNEAGLEFFEKKIRPVLVDQCYKCHSAKSEKVKGGLLLDSRAGLLKGGDSGPSIVPGKPGNSLLIKAIGYGDPDL